MDRVQHKRPNSGIYFNSLMGINILIITDGLESLESKESSDMNREVPSPARLDCLSQRGFRQIVSINDNFLFGFSLTLVSSHIKTGASGKG